MRWLYSQILIYSIYGTRGTYKIYSTIFIKILYRSEIRIVENSKNSNNTVPA